MNVVTKLYQQLLLVVDEASLLRMDVFRELHTLTQFEGDSRPWLPVILVGQKSLGENTSPGSSTPSPTACFRNRSGEWGMGSGEWLYPYEK